MHVPQIHNVGIFGMMALVMSAMHRRAATRQSPVSPVSLCCYPLSNDPVQLSCLPSGFPGPCGPFPEDFCFYKSDISGVVVANISCHFSFTSFFQANLVTSSSILPSVPCNLCPVARHFSVQFSAPPPPLASRKSELVVLFSLLQSWDNSTVGALCVV